MNRSLPFRLRDIDIRLSEAFTRMPFRYGNACLTAVPIAHVRATLESSRGETASGLAADCLPPRWFDKDPGKDFRRNVEDQLAAIQMAREVSLAVVDDVGSPTAAYPLWEQAHPEIVRRVGAAGLNKLTASFGGSLVERAVIDATCRLAGLSFHDALRSGALGYHAGPEIAARPLESILCRHTVGLGDAIRRQDIADDDLLDDGLPQALEEDIEAYGLRYFKVKVNGEHERDLERLRRMAELFAGRCGDGYRISFDGNEQSLDLPDLERLLDALQTTDVGRRFVDSVLYIEQPLSRDVALSGEVEAAVRRLSDRKPVIIDESDEDVDAFERAVALGYRGCSVKNCKGVFKALRNRALCHRLNGEAGAELYFQTGEDLANLPVIPLQQDLTTLSSLGIDNAERNGHHYFRGLAHLPKSEREAAVDAHPDLYRREADEGFLRISAGEIHCASLAAPGYGYSGAIAFDERVAAADWRFERLKL